MVVDITAKLHTASDAPDFIKTLNLEQPRLKRHASTGTKSVDYALLPPKKKMCLDYFGKTEADAMPDSADVFSSEDDDVVVGEGRHMKDEHQNQELHESQVVADGTKQMFRERMRAPRSNGPTSDVLRDGHQAARDKILRDHLKDSGHLSNVRTVVVPVYVPVPVLDVPGRKSDVPKRERSVPARHESVDGSHRWRTTGDSPFQQGPQQRRVKPPRRVEPPSRVEPPRLVEPPPLLEPLFRDIPNRMNPDFQSPTHNAISNIPSPDCRAPMYRFTAGRSYPEIQLSRYCEIHSTKGTHEAPLYYPTHTINNRVVPITAYKYARGPVRETSPPDTPPYLRRTMPPPVYCPPPRRSRSFSERTQPIYNFLPKDPREWTKPEVHQWLFEISRKYGIQGATPDRFPMNGKGVNMMNLTMFLDRAPLGGHILYNEFSRRVSNALTQGTAVRAASA